MMMDDSDDDGSQIFEAEYQEEDLAEDDDYSVEIIGNLNNNHSLSEPMDETSNTVNFIANEDPESVILFEKFSQESLFKVL
jgi:hypothetical protein